MKHYTREQLQKIAADVFGRYPNARTVACTEDGVPFITDETERYVKEHARSGKYAGGLKIEYFRRCDMPEKAAETQETETQKTEEVRQPAPENGQATAAPESPKARRTRGSKGKNTGKKAPTGKPKAAIPEASVRETTAVPEETQPQPSPATEADETGKIDNQKNE